MRLIRGGSFTPDSPEDGVETTTEPETTEHPEGLSLWNHATGPVAVSRTAWTRFIECYIATTKLSPTIKRSISYFIGHFAESFCRAAPQEIDPVHKTIRIINHGMKGALYLHDSSCRLRYVVSEDRPYRLITVEIPY
jgi:hypothetical protein